MTDNYDAIPQGYLPGAIHYIDAEMDEADTDETDMDLGKDLLKKGRAPAMDRLLVLPEMLSTALTSPRFPRKMKNGATYVAPAAQPDRLGHILRQMQSQQTTDSLGSYRKYLIIFILPLVLFLFYCLFKVAGFINSRRDSRMIKKMYQNIKNGPSSQVTLREIEPILFETAGLCADLQEKPEEAAAIEKKLQKIIRKIVLLQKKSD